VDANPDGPAADDVEELAAAVLTASRLLVGIAVRSLAAVGDQVTMAQFRMLALLASRGDSNLVSLAERLMVNPSTALRMVERLAETGLISRKVNPASRREVLLRLTPAGQQLVGEVTACRREEISGILTRMSPGDRTGLVQALAAFAEAGGEVPGGEWGLSMGMELARPRGAVRQDG
jgi:DNA-binding MarR family transcriptional regulator